MKRVSLLKVKKVDWSETATHTNRWIYYNCAEDYVVNDTKFRGADGSLTRVRVIYSARTQGQERTDANTWQIVHHKTADGRVSASWYSNGIEYRADRPW